MSKIFLCGITPTPPHEKISKTALGAEKWIPWEYHKQTWQLLGKFKNDKINIVALEKIKGSQNIFKFNFKFKSKFPLALILGNEVNGLSQKILKYCDKKMAIPMYGRKESLNVAVAVGIALYAIRHSGEWGESRS